MSFRNLVQVAPSEWVDPEEIVAVVAECAKNELPGHEEDVIPLSLVYLSSGETIEVGVSVEELFEALDRAATRSARTRVGRRTNMPTDVYEELDASLERAYDVVD